MHAQGCSAHHAARLLLVRVNYPATTIECNDHAPLRCGTRLAQEVAPGAHGVAASAANARSRAPVPHGWHLAPVHAAAILAVILPGKSSYVSGRRPSRSGRMPNAACDDNGQSAAQRIGTASANTSSRKKRPSPSRRRAAVHSWCPRRELNSHVPRDTRPST